MRMAGMVADKYSRYKETHYDLHLRGCAPGINITTVYLRTSVSPTGKFVRKSFQCVELESGEGKLPEAADGPG